MDKSQKKLNFWDMDNILGAPNVVESPERLLDKKEMDFIAQKLWKRLNIYKESKCFGYLEKFYSHYLNVDKQKNKRRVDDLFEDAMNNLKFFTFCYEQENQGKQ